MGYGIDSGDSQISLMRTREDNQLYLRQTIIICTTIVLCFAIFFGILAWSNRQKNDNSVPKQISSDKVMVAVVDACSSSESPAAEIALCVSEVKSQEWTD